MDWLAVMSIQLFSVKFQWNKKGELLAKGHVFKKTLNMADNTELCQLNASGQGYLKNETQPKRN
jgi:hypothetical protein